ncbi:MAG: hypothetical protein US94_C0040G0002 [Berkelbacteria bacterium GW2011_GWB1_38_5]|uniref:Uncharacterized protein n=1 Tax=Berkelbacteria bacterium GW2011_GWB1_38_5 TaxID=1618336 RepID=A0A0G0JZ49_9BACT|nr:MAG: hypothetical protein US94_C0040G0002 [Berkelbacteria bacterium GW2011_GWB1_38_5]
MTRNIEIRYVGLITAIEGPIFAWLNQNDILSQFSCVYPILLPTFSTFVIRTHSNPISLDFPVDNLLQQITREAKDRSGFIWQEQSCLQLGGPVSLEKILTPVSAKQIKTEDLVHVMAHLLLTHIIDCRRPWIDLDQLGNFAFEELVYLNIHNPTETFITFNFPVRVEDAGKFAGIVMTFIDRWINGQPTRGLIKKMNRYHNYLQELLPNV